MHISDDIDHVPIDPKPTKAPRKKPPEPWPLPAYTPMQINNPLTYGCGNLPNAITPDQPYEIFSLFFNNETLQILANHTNEYATGLPSVADKPYARDWYPTTVKELRAYIGTYIWMGIFPNSAVEDYWNRDPLRGPVHETVFKYISIKRWQQIDRFFHISKPQPPGSVQSPFDKLEPLNENLRCAFKLYWKIGTHLAVDETVQRFLGRAKECVNIPSKPTPKGFKIWVLANAGYVLDWLYHCKGDDSGPVDLDNYWTDDRGFSNTQAVVLDLLSQNGVSKEHQHIVWLDNLFTSVRLLSVLKEEGFGAAGTVRTKKTEREVLEESRGTKAQRKNLPKEKNRGLLPSLSALKLEHSTQLEWGKLYGCISECRQVLEFAWKDQNVVLFMSTVTTGGEKVSRLRRRPPKTATNARTSRAAFGEDVVKELAIPEFIDMYNHFMNGVDRADQLRCYYTTQRKHLKNWKPLWHFLLDTTVVNSYKIARCTPERPFGEPWDHSSHKGFRRELAIQLFQNSERLAKASLPKKSLDQDVHPAAPKDHGGLVRLGAKPSNCVACKAAGRREAHKATNRKPLQELSSNTIRAGKRREKLPRSLFGCGLCGIHLCNHTRCWNEHIRAIR